MTSMNKAMKKLTKQAEAQGWRVEPTRNGHIRFLAPDGKTIVIWASTPSDHRAWKNGLSQMKRAGFQP